MKHLNFIPDSYRSELRRESNLRRVSFLLLTITLATAAIGIYFFQESQDLSVEANALERDMEQHHLATKRLTFLGAKQAELTANLALKEKIKNPVPTASLIVLLQRSMPDSVALTDIDIQRHETPITVGKQKTAVAKAGAGEVLTTHTIHLVLKGIAPRDIDVARLVSELSSEDIFQQVRLVRSEPLKLDQIRGKKFEIHADFSLDRQFNLMAKVVY